MLGAIAAYENRSDWQPKIERCHGVAALVHARAAEIDHCGILHCCRQHGLRISGGSETFRFTTYLPFGAGAV